MKAISLSPIQFGLTTQSEAILEAAQKLPAISNPDDKAAKELRAANLAFQCHTTLSELTQATAEHNDSIAETERLKAETIGLDQAPELSTTEKLQILRLQAEFQNRIELLKSAQTNRVIQVGNQLIGWITKAGSYLEVESVLKALEEFPHIFDGYEHIEAQIVSFLSTQLEKHKPEVENNRRTGQYA